MGNGKVIIISAPSGAGKSTLVKHILKYDFSLEFSISATSRLPRGKEKYGLDYYFLTQDEFRKKIENHEFVEYEEVYAGLFYGTLKTEVNRILEAGKNIIFDVDVKGGLKLKNHFGNEALSIFVAPPSIEALRERLINRATDSSDKINERLAKAKYEMGFAKNFDKILVNDDLSLSEKQLEDLVRSFLNC